MGMSEATRNTSGSGRVANSRRNAVMGLVRSAVTLLASFVTRTVLIRTFGVEYAGLGGLFSSVLQVLNLAELGLSTAIVYALYEPVAKGDHTSVCAYLGFIRRAYRVVGAAMLVVGVAIAPVLPWLVEGGRVPADVSLYACWAIFLVDAVLSYLTFGYLSCVPTADQRGDLLTSTDAVVAVVRCVLQVAMLQLHLFYGYLLALPCATLLWNLAVWRRVRRRYPQYACGGHLDDDRRASMRKNVCGLLLKRVCSVLRNGIDVVCVSAFCGLALAGVYQNYLLVLSGLIAVTSVLLQAIIPSVGNSVVLESADKNHDDLMRFDFLYTSAAGWVATGLLCLWQPFMALWVGEGLLLGWPEVCGLVLYYYLLKAGDMWSVYGEALGLWWRLRRISVAETAANVVLNVALCRWLGVGGVIVASLVTILFLSFVPGPRILWASYFEGRRVRTFFAAHALWALSSVPGAASCVVLCSVIPEGLAGLLLRGVVCAVVYPVLWWLLWRRSGTFADAVAWLRRAGLLGWALRDAHEDGGR